MNSNQYIFSILVDNEIGILSRIVGLFSSRGFNIKSLTVSEIDKTLHLSCVTITIIATNKNILQIKLQLLRLIPVHSVTNFTSDSSYIEREMALIKITVFNKKYTEVLKLADKFRVYTINSFINGFIFEITGSQNKINQFIEFIKILGTIKIVRTGIVAISCNFNSK